MSRKNPWKTLKTSKIYTNPWIDVHHDEVITPGGNSGIYGKVHYKNIAVGVIPLDEEGHTYIVGQYRYVLDTYSWEITEGGSPIGIDPLISAQRELEEETGITATSWQQIMHLHTSNSVCDEEAFIFLARDLSLGPASPEDTEELEVKKLPFVEVVKMVHRGEITDAMSVAAILKLSILLAEGGV